jgi:hypothetical protein
MTRDTFDRFAPQERGRFGENESASRRMSLDPDSDDQAYIGINLHLHHTRWEGASLLLSRDGKRGNAHHVPKSLMKDHDRVTHRLVKGGGEATRLGQYHVKRWKLQQLGWLGAEDDEGQGRLI